MPVNQLLACQYLGLGGNPMGGAVAKNTFALSTTATYLALGFTPQASKTISNIRVFVSSITGTPTSGGTLAGIWSDSGGSPGSAITGGGNQSASTAPAAGAWINFSGFTAAVSQGSAYWVVLQTSDTSGVNYPTYQFMTNAFGFPFSAQWYKKSSTNSGGAWSSQLNNVQGLRIGYSDGSYDGLPISTSANSSAIFGSNLLGAKFTLPGPSNLTYNIAGLSFPVIRTGSPTGNPVFYLYNGTTLVATTGQWNGFVNNGQHGEWIPLFFSSTQTLAGGTTCRIVVGDSAADSSGNAFLLNDVLTWDTDANSANLVPLEGTWQQTSYNGTSWTDTAGTLPYGLLLLDSTGELTASGGGSSGGFIIGG